MRISTGGANSVPLGSPLKSFESAPAAGGLLDDEEELQEQSRSKR